MFKKKKKLPPPDTFIPTPKRLVAIIQLCVAFSLILWYATQPFMGEYFALRSRMLLYEYAMGSSELLKSQPDRTEKLERNVQRFANLPTKDRVLILKDYHFLQSRALRSTLTKIHDGLHAFLLEIPPFELAWLFFSSLIAILILLKTEGASQAAWLLPLIVLAYGIDNQINGRVLSPSPDLTLFPTETFIVQNYLNQPLQSHWMEQQKQLQEGWQRYLAQSWPHDSSQDWEGKVEEGEFNFTIARLLRLHGQSEQDWLSVFNEKVSNGWLGVYFLWNFFFAWIINRPLQRKASFNPLHGQQLITTRP